MTRGNQREQARAKAQKKRAEDLKRNQKSGNVQARNAKFVVTFFNIYIVARF